MDSNKIRLDYTDNPDLAEGFSRAKAGDKVNIEVALQIDEITDKGVVGSIEKVTFESESDEEGEGMEAAPMPDKPMAIDMNVGQQPAAEDEQAQS